VAGSMHCIILAELLQFSGANSTIIRQQMHSNRVWETSFLS